MTDLVCETVFVSEPQGIRGINRKLRCNHSLNGVTFCIDYENNTRMPDVYITKVEAFKLAMWLLKGLILK